MHFNKTVIADNGDSWTHNGAVNIALVAVSVASSVIAIVAIFYAMKRRENRLNNSGKFAIYSLLMHATRLHKVYFLMYSQFYSCQRTYGQEGQLTKLHVGSKMKACCQRPISPIVKVHILTHFDTF